MAEPVTRCGACGQEDDHPKHQILVGFNNPSTGGQMFHEHDTDRDGSIQYHFDCPSEWHTAVGVDSEYIGRVAALASSGTHGDALREAIVSGQVAPTPPASTNGGNA